MNSLAAKRAPYTQLIYRPFWVIAGSLLIILTLASAVLINASWHALHRIEPLKTHLALITELERYSGKLESLLPLSKIVATEALLVQLTPLHKALTRFSQRSSNILSDEAAGALQRATEQLQNVKAGLVYDLSSVKKDIRSALRAEADIQGRLLHLLKHDNQLELESAISIVIMLPLLTLLMLFVMRHRILRPLDSLGLLINQLGRQRPQPISLEQVAPPLRSLFIDFNSMLLRLAELEQQQQKQQQELERRVRHATQSLLEHHNTLAQSERLAAVGELTARLAHELRNPLAGIHLTLANLCDEIKDDDQQARLTLVLEELKRITALLNRVLGESRHSPEAASHFKLAGVVTTLLQLVRYQIPSQIKIEQRVPADIACLLPQGRLRQALLNLILNAAQSIGKAPGQIIIEATAEEGGINICIRDSGPGFSAMLLERGIHSFATDRENGSGLGLGIVRRFCSDLGGSLTLSNHPAGGACVVLILPGRQQYER